MVALLYYFIEKLVARRLLAHSYVMHILIGSFYGGKKTEHNREIGSRFSSKLSRLNAFWRNWLALKRARML